MSSTPVHLGYFGKLPSRGDFVRSAQQPALLQMLDHWLSQAMEALATDAAWKQAFDAAQPLYFAFVGPKRRVALAGHLAPSQDAGGRRFPFVTVGSFDVVQPATFVGVSPLALTRLWTRLATSARLALSAEDLAEAQPQLNASHVDIQPDAPGWQAALDDYLEGHKLGDFEAQMRVCEMQPAAHANGDHGATRAGAPFSARRSLLALGLLLQPVITQGVAQLNKYLVLPLPGEPNLRAVVAALWMQLICRFVLRWDAELALFFVAHDGRAQMVVGFNGASPTMLRTMLETGRADQGPFASDTQHLIDIAQADWVEDVVRTQGDYGLRKLSSYLQDPQLSLRQAMVTFREVFLGE